MHAEPRRDGVRKRLGCTLRLTSAALSDASRRRARTVLKAPPTNAHSSKHATIAETVTVTAVCFSGGGGDDDDGGRSMDGIELPAFGERSDCVSRPLPS